MLTEEVIKNVPMRDAWRLMVEPTFYVYGELHKLYSMEELKRQELPIIHKAILDDDEYSDVIAPNSGTIKRSICDLVTAMQSDSDIEFDLVRPLDCRLILACIDKFLEESAKLVRARAILLDTEVLQDYRTLGDLALAMFDMSEEIRTQSEMEQLNKENAGKVSFFDIRLTNIADEEATIITHNNRWINPFQTFIDNRLGVRYPKDSAIAFD